MSKDAVSIKGTKNGLVILLDPNRKFEDLKNTLQKKMESSQGFLTGAKFTFYSGPYKLIPDQQYELESICRQYGLIPQKEPVAPEIEQLFTPARHQKPKNNNHPGEETLLVKRTLRSGHFVAHPTNIVVLGNIHPGAVVKAGGSILVMGRCLGHVHAGVWGEENAVIAALDLSPKVLSIADKVHSGQIPAMRRGIQKACLSGGKIIFTSET